MPQDVFKILKDLELKAVGLDEQTQKMQEGYFVSFRSVGLPIHKDDYDNPWDPFGGNVAAALEKARPPQDAKDPKDAEKTASDKMTEDKIALAQIGKSMKSYLNTFLLTDDKLQMNNQWSVMPSSTKVSDSWWTITTGANGIPTKLELNEAMKKAYEEATAKLMDKDDNPTPQYQKYMEYQDAYRSKVRAWNKAYANAITDPTKFQAWPREGKLYHDEADEAFDRWTSMGHKVQIEQALNILAAQGVDPAMALINRSRKRFLNSLLEFPNIGQIPYTIMLPNTWYDADNDDGWNEYGANDFHTESHYSASSTSYGGGGGFSLGLWSMSGGFSKSESQKSLQTETQNLEVNFKYCAVDIKRYWLDTSLLNLKNWFLMGDYKKNCISNGTMGQHLPGNGFEPAFLPSIVTSLILIKDLNIRWKDWKSTWETHTKSTTGNLSFGYGPFALKGNYSHHSEQRDFSADDEGEYLKSPGIQLIGYVSAINPACPAEDSSKYLTQPQG